MDTVISLRLGLVVHELHRDGVAAVDGVLLAEYRTVGSVTSAGVPEYVNLQVTRGLGQATRRLRVKRRHRQRYVLVRAVLRYDSTTAVAGVLIAARYK